jgi:hypothetical protein
MTNRLMQLALIVTCLALSFVSVEAQKKKAKKAFSGTPILWEQVDVASQDLYLGPGGQEMIPDLSSIKFIRQEKGGYSKKFRIEDGSGNIWVAKIGREAQSETAAVRLLSAIGYKTEVNYLVPRLTIPGQGTFSNVRLEARPRDVDRGDPWKWGRSPFEKTRQMQGLKLMMAFLNNWDMKSDNNVVLRYRGKDYYAISDLGVSFGKTGNNSLPLFWRIGRSRNMPEDYARARYIKGVSKDRVHVLFNGKNRRKVRDITRADARWLADLLTQLSDKQIRDAFRAANYTPAQINILTQAVKNRIIQLDQAGSYDRLATR